MESYFTMSAAAHEIRRPFSDLRLLELELDEMEARHAAWSSSAALTPGRARPTAVLNHDAIWDRINGRTSKASVEHPAPRASATTIDTDAVWRKFNGGGANPDSVLEKK